jgi:branched-chain amino acid aminotransferase
MSTSPTFVLHPSDQPKSKEEREALMSSPRFGSIFSDHMVTMRFRDGAWQDGELCAYGNLSLSPATSALHYGQAVFEGLKAYRHADGSLHVFRPDMNAKRFASSARRLAMAEMPVETFIEAVDILVATDRQWVPTTPGSSLYLRPLLFPSEAALRGAP